MDEQQPSPVKKPSRFWKVFRLIYPFVVLAVLYVLWKDVLPAYRFLTKPVASVTDTPPAGEPLPPPESAITPQSLLESSPSALPGIKEVVEKMAPNSARAHVGLGLLYESKGKPDEAVGYYRRAVELDPALPEAQFRLGYALFSRKELRAAERSFEAAIKAKPDYLPAWYGLAAVQQADNRPSAAQKSYETILAANKDEYQALNNLGIIHEDAGEGARALGCYEAAAKLKPSDPIVADNAEGARKMFGEGGSKPCVSESALAAAALPAPAAPVQAAPVKKAKSAASREIRMKNGQTLYGEIVEETKDGLWFESGDGARVYVSKNELA